MLENISSSRVRRFPGLPSTVLRHPPAGRSTLSSSQIAFSSSDSDDLPLPTLQTVTTPANPNDPVTDDSESGSDSLPTPVVVSPPLSPTPPPSAPVRPKEGSPTRSLRFRPAAAPPAPSPAPPPAPSVNVPEPPAPVYEEAVNSLFSITWTNKKMLKMIQNDQAVYYAKHFRDSWVLSSSPDTFDLSSPAYCGRLLSPDSGNGYILELPGIEGPVFGYHSYKPPDLIGVRAFRIVYPKETPYCAQTKEMGLCQLAKRGKADPAKFLTFWSRMPSKTVTGRLILPFGEGVSLIKSVKNFIVDDVNGNAVFVIYKSSQGSCTVKITAPITPVAGFAIGIACIAKNR